MRIGADGGRSGAKQPLAMGPDEGAAMPPADHVRLADILIDAARARRQMREGVVLPGVHGIILGVSEGAAAMLDDPHRHPLIGKRLRRRLQLRRAPPFNHMRPPAPAREQVEVGRGDGAEGVSGHGRLA
jgi:hypothetical protein